MGAGRGRRSSAAAAAPAPRPRPQPRAGKGAARPAAGHGPAAARRLAACKRRAPRTWRPGGPRETAPAAARNGARSCAGRSVTPAGPPEGSGRRRGGGWGPASRLRCPPEGSGGAPPRGWPCQETGGAAAASSCGERGQVRGKPRGAPPSRPSERDGAAATGGGRRRRRREHRRRFFPGAERGETRRGGEVKREVSSNEQTQHSGALVPLVAACTLACL